MIRCKSIAFNIYVLKSFSGWIKTASVDCDNLISFQGCILPISVRTLLSSIAENFLRAKSTYIGLDCSKLPLNESFCVGPEDDLMEYFFIDWRIFSREFSEEFCDFFDCGCVVLFVVQYSHANGSLRIVPYGFETTLNKCVQLDSFLKKFKREQIQEIMIQAIDRLQICSSIISQKLNNGDYTLFI